MLNLRMTVPESIEAATGIVDCYPNGGNSAGKGYIGALAATLASYPRQVAHRCADRDAGVVRECRFLPTVADIVAWCERETDPLYRQSQRESNIARQFAERAEFEREQTRERARRLTIAELRAKYGDWTLPPDKPSPFSVRQIDAAEIEISPYLKAAIQQREAAE